MAHIIDGKKISQAVKAQIAERRAAFENETGIKPGLAVIIVGENPASQVYVRNKKKACEEVGFKSEIIALPESTTQDELKDALRAVIDDDTIHGVLVQLPLPAHLDEKEVIEMIPPEMDVDAFHPINTGKIMIGDYDFLPCTPAGIMKMLEYESISPSGKECVVIGRSNIVGKPMAMLLLHANGTVTICHSKTKNLSEVTKRADILVSAVGKAHFVTADMVKDGAVVIDVGMNRDENGKLTGDVAFDEVEKVASAITPVPGGVGVMTVTMLLENTLRAAEMKAGLRK